MQLGLFHYKNSLSDAPLTKRPSPVGRRMRGVNGVGVGGGTMGKTHISQGQRCAPNTSRSPSIGLLKSFCHSVLSMTPVSSGLWDEESGWNFWNSP